MAFGILGTGAAYPDKVVTNFDLEKIVDTSDEWIFSRSGIKERRISEASEATSDFAALAGQRAIQAAGLNAEDIDLIVCCTTTPDSMMPSTACLIQKKLSIPDCGAYDINCACSGFIYGMATAHGLLNNGLVRHALVVGADVLSKFVDWEDRGTCVLFGDGAGAVVLGAVDEGQGILSELISADGRQSDCLTLLAGGTRLPLSQKVLDNRDQFIKMDGKEVFRFAVGIMPQVLEEVAKKAQLETTDYDWIIPHQANIRIIDAAVKRLELPMERFIVNLDRFGNTSAASIPVALDEAVRDGRIQRGQLLGMVAFGGGVTWAGSMIRY